MAFSRTTTTGDGSTVTFPINFTLGYLSEDDITCQVGGEVDGSGDPVYRPLTFLTSSLVTIGGDTPGDGEEIIFERTIDKTQMQNDFNNDDVLDELNLDNSFLQIMHATHEALDGRFPSLGADLGAGGFKITDLGTPTEDGDAANKAYVDGLTGADQAAAAAVSAAAALASETAAAAAAASAEAFAASRFDAVITNPVDADNWVATNSNFPDTPTDNVEVVGQAIADGTGALAMIVTNGTTPWPSKSVVKAGGDAFESGDIINQYDYVFRYNSTIDAFQQVGGGSGGSVIVVRDTFTGDGVDTAFTLSVTPGADAELEVYIDGVHQHEDEWSFSGTTLTIPEAPVNGSKITAKISNQAGSAAVPADGSVTAAKIANGAIDATAKLANDVVTPEKRTHQFYIAREQETSSGTKPIAAGDNVRDLNTEVIDDFGTVSLSSGQISGLPAGRYRVSGYTTKYGYSGTITHQAFLYNVTDATVAIPGHSGYTSTSTSESIHIFGVIDVEAGKVFELRQWSSGTLSNGGGFTSSKRTDLDLVYSEITFERIGA